MFLKLGIRSKFYISNQIIFAFALFLQEIFSRNLDQFEKGEVTVFSGSGQLYKKSYVVSIPFKISI